MGVSLLKISKRLFTASIFLIWLSNLELVTIPKWESFLHFVGMAWPFTWRISNFCIDSFYLSSMCFMYKILFMVKQKYLQALVRNATDAMRESRVIDIINAVSHIFCF